MWRKVINITTVICLTFVVSGCMKRDTTVKIGVSLGVGAATRWEKEAMVMERRAEELGAEMELRLNRTDEPLTQEEDCKEMIDRGIDVLIITPRNVNDVGAIVDYAKEKNVKVISYSRLITGKKIDLYIGYDSNKIGQMLGQYLSETVDKGDYIILQGDPGDYNSELLYQGAMRYINMNKDTIRTILDAPVVDWNVDEAKTMVKNAIAENGGNVDAIMAPNDKIAGACAQALAESGITKQVPITGMDAEIEAIRRIVEGSQGVTVYMNLDELASTAVNEAVHMAKNETVESNGKYDNHSGEEIDANLLTGKLITDKNIDKLLIDTGYVTREQVYGSSE